MLESRLSRALMGLGVAIGVGSVAVWALEVRLVNLPDWMVRVALIKLAFIASFGLLAAGAVVGRHAKSREVNDDGPVERLGEGSAQTIEQQRGSHVPVERSDTPE